jgi:cytochrome P450
MNAHSTAPNVFEAGLPTFTYGLDATPHDVLEDARLAQSRAPIAIGPLGPEILSYDLARDILRDNRYRLAPGITLAAQGITSGPLYDKMATSLLGLDGAPHVRLRKLVSRAFTPRATAGLQDTIHEVVNGLIDRVMEAGRCDVVTDIARPYPTPIMCAFLGAPREDGSCSRTGLRRSSKPSTFSQMPPSMSPRSCAHGANSTPTSTTWSPPAATI